jgi:uracil phosphoribosyltransferase
MAPQPPPAFPNLTVPRHPLIAHKLAVLRDRMTTKQTFRAAIDEISMLLGYEVTRELPLEEVQVETPLEHTTAHMISGKKLTLVPILRAGLGMLDGMLRLMPSARVGHLGMYRDHDTLEPVSYYFRIPDDAGAREFIVLDPMLATGGSAVAAIAALKQNRPARIRFVCIVAAPAGVQRMFDSHPDVPIHAAALDRQLDANGYIVPGLGDAGDRMFGTR